MIKEQTKGIIENNLKKGILEGEIDIENIFKIGIKEELTEKDYLNMYIVEINKYEDEIYYSIYNILECLNIYEEFLGIKYSEIKRPIKILNLQQLLDNYKNINLSYFFNDNFEVISEKIELKGFNSLSLKGYNCNFDFIIKNCEFKKDVIFVNCLFEKNIKLENCTFEGLLKITNSTIKGEINFLNTNLLKDHLLLEGNIINTLTFENCNFKEDFYILGGKIETIFGINMCVFQKEVIIKDIKNGFKFILSGLRIDKNIDFTNLNILKCEFRNTHFKNSLFNGVKINKLYLENATLNDCIFNGVEFGNDYILKNIKDEEGNINYFKMKDNYRQLKFVMDKNGNNTEANKFFTREMDNYYLSLNWKENFPRKLLLFIQNVISFFGNSWIRVILWIFALVLLTTLFNSFYLYLKIDNTFINPLESFEGYFNLFLNLLYPLYGLKKDYIDGLDNWLTLGFILYKLIYGVLLWHLIVALKRTTKR